MTTVIKKVLASTLKELMEEKSLSKITINDLTQSCGVSRQTFYNNFIDIYDLVEWIYLQDTEILVGKDVTYDNWQDALASIFQYIHIISSIFCVLVFQLVFEPSKTFGMVYCDS